MLVQPSEGLQCSDSLMAFFHFVRYPWLLDAHTSIVWMGLKVAAYQKCI